MMMEVVTIYEQHELAKEFLKDVCCMNNEEVNNNYRNVILGNTWDSSEDDNGYYEITEDIAVLNANEFMGGIRDF